MTIALYLLQAFIDDPIASTPDNRDALGHAMDSIVLRRQHRRALFEALRRPCLTESHLVALMQLLRSANAIVLFNIITKNLGEVQYIGSPAVKVALRKLIREQPEMRQKETRRLLRMLDWSIRSVQLYIRLPTDRPERAVAAECSADSLDDVLNLSDTVKVRAEPGSLVHTLIEKLDKAKTDTDVVRIVRRWLKKQGYNEASYVASKLNRQRQRLRGPVNPVLPFG